jgi:hypothetical protein
VLDAQAAQQSDSHSATLMRSALRWGRRSRPEEWRMDRATPPPPPPTGARSSTTTLVGGCGIVLALLYPLVASGASTFPNVFGLLLAPPGLSVVLWAVFAVACGVLAFGLPGETGIAGPSPVGRAALFVFGVHRLVLDLSSVLTPLPATAGLFWTGGDASGGSGGDALSAAFIGGYVSLGVNLLGSLAGLVAAVAVVRAGVLHGAGRWMLVPAAVLDLLGLVLVVVPVQEVVMLAFAISTLWYLLMVAIGVAYALDGRGPAIRRLGRRLDAWW